MRIPGPPLTAGRRPPGSESCDRAATGPIPGPPAMSILVGSSRMSCSSDPSWLHLTLHNARCLINVREGAQLARSLGTGRKVGAWCEVVRLDPIPATIRSSPAHFSSGRFGSPWAWGIHVPGGRPRSPSASGSDALADFTKIPERRIRSLRHENVADRTAARPIQSMSVGKPIPVKDD
jgi:hypothetical protein